MKMETTTLARILAKGLVQSRTPALTFATFPPMLHMATHFILITTL